MEWQLIKLWILWVGIGNMIEMVKAKEKQNFFLKTIL